jgi:hypothetical protein
VRLHQLRRAQIRSLELPLFELRDEEKLPTGCLLDVRITCVEPGRSYYVEVKADFGSLVPPVARLKVARRGAPETNPLPLVEGGTSVEQGLPLEMDGSVDRIVFWVETEGSTRWPATMAGAIELRPVTGSLTTLGAKTRKMPVVRQDPKKGFTRALLGSSSPTLATLGQILEGTDDGRKLELLAQLLERDADVRLLEVAVRDLGAEIDFASSRLSGEASACVAILHPASPPALVLESLQRGLQRQGGALEPAKVRLWRQLIRCAVLVLHRRDPDQLDEILEEQAFAEESATLAILRPLVEWAEERSSQPQLEAEVSIEDCLEDVKKGEPGAAEAAAVDLAIGWGLACVTAELE